MLKLTAQLKSGICWDFEYNAPYSEEKIIRAVNTINREWIVIQDQRHALLFRKADLATLHFANVQ